MREYKANAREALDGVIVCTPNDVHYPASLAALEQNYHVMCEKPLTMHAGNHVGVGTRPLFV